MWLLSCFANANRIIQFAQNESTYSFPPTNCKIFLKYVRKFPQLSSIVYCVLCDVWSAFSKMSEHAVNLFKVSFINLSSPQLLVLFYLSTEPSMKKGDLVIVCLENVLRGLIAYRESFFSFFFRCYKMPRSSLIFSYIWRTNVCLNLIQICRLQLVNKPIILSFEF